MSRLEADLQSLDGRSYKAYRDLNSSYKLGDFILLFDHIQGDPFAAPSHCRVVIPQSVAGYRNALFATHDRAVALRDYINRKCYQSASRFASHKGSGKSGLIAIAKTSQAVLERTSVLIDSDRLEIRFTVGLPAYGRRIAGREAIELLCDRIPEWIESSALHDSLDPEQLQTHLETVEDAIALRNQLQGNQWVAFIADGAILPRESGVSDRPLTDAPLPFTAPDTLRATLDTPHSGAISGLAIPEGVVLIVGGGFHGKSTLLQALQQGIYNHIPGDGREKVVTLESAMKIRSEEGRSVQGVDLSPFINHLPMRGDTQSFCTNNASGSTSQAASIMESIEAGAQLLLLDEDTCATNFMIRDRRMQALIGGTKEPITPYIDQVQTLYRECGVSSILVIGGCGDYFDVADTVLALDQFEPFDKTGEAKAIATQFPSDRDVSVVHTFTDTQARYLTCGHPWFRSKRDRRLKTKVYDLTTLEIGDQRIDVAGHEQFVEAGQLRAIAQTLIAIHQQVSAHKKPKEMSLASVTDWIKDSINPLDNLTDKPDGQLGQLRRQDVYFVLNRLRSLECQTQAES